MKLVVVRRYQTRLELQNFVANFRKRGFGLTFGIGKAYFRVCLFYNNSRRSKKLWCASDLKTGSRPTHSPLAHR